MAAISCPLIRVTRLRLAAREGRPLWTSIFGPPVAGLRRSLELRTAGGWLHTVRKPQKKPRRSGAKSNGAAERRRKRDPYPKHYHRNGCTGAGIRRRKRGNSMEPR